ncbi:MAG: 30S ribosomal protein S3 [Thermoprotei archaeon]|nr:MAG: 30S ribosomal protein S3 [Thermoprotei archaeon]RLE88748.1 MAG: 30S ribosomal protein S3 [Thermoprotei archaeon]
MDIGKKFIMDGILRMELYEFLSRELVRAGYIDLQVFRTPIGHRLVIYAERPGMVIGRRGMRVRELATVLEKRFNLENPQIDIAQIDTPDLNAKIVAYHIGRALMRGVRYGRAAFIALRRIMEAGAIGAEVVMSGKLTSDRARTVKFTRGIVPKSGYPREILVDEAKISVLLKPGVYGVKVKIYKPVAKLPDRITIVEATSHAQTESK